MITEVTTRWAFTVVFAAAALGAVLPRLARGFPEMFCAGMCASCTAMAWWAEPATATRVQAGLFAAGAVWFVLFGRPLLGQLIGLTGVAMVWMLIAMPGGIVSVLLAVGCAAAALLWLTRPGGGRAALDSVSLSHAAMSAGMAAMLLVLV